MTAWSLLCDIISQYDQLAMQLQVLMLMRSCWNDEGSVKDLSACWDLKHELTDIAPLEEPVCWRRLGQQRAFRAELLIWNSLPQETSKKRGFAASPHKMNDQKEWWWMMRNVLRSLGPKNAVRRFVVPKERWEHVKDDLDVPCEVMTYSDTPDAQQIISHNNSFVLVFVEPSESWIPAWRVKLQTWKQPRSSWSLPTSAA
ncbi:unnamed protein product [Effrenium voratum]|uniref:Uncharacterized protein n=1 Tax=Effrenium voratum TaxID=2562239 RepID=A0AA36JDA1_9DINO|nr:unnamed protein product [Effrenium voratum]